MNVLFKTTSQQILPSKNGGLLVTLPCSINMEATVTFSVIDLKGSDVNKEREGGVLRFKPRVYLLQTGLNGTRAHPAPTQRWSDPC